MPKFNNRVATTRTPNIAGGNAFSMTPEVELTHAVLSTFLKDEFYESGDDRAKRIAALVAKVVSKDPKFVAQLAKVARSEFHIRSATTVLLGSLAEAHKGDDLVKRGIVAATERVDDLMELAAYTGMPMPKQVKRGIRNALLKFNRYQLAKYKGEGKAISLVDLFNLVHPKAQHASEEQKQAWADLIKGELKSTETWEATISAAGKSEDKEEATKKGWEDLVLEKKIGYMALIRNLNNLVKAGVSEEVIDAAVAKLILPSEIERSKLLPFRFYTAFQNVKGNRKLSDAISDAMDIAVSNVPKFDGKMLIAVDTSGSMSGDPIEKAAIFAATMAKANDADVLVYDTTTKYVPVSSRSPVLDIAQHIINGRMGGGTATSMVFTTANQKYDHIVILSDNQSWSDYGGDVQHAYADYCKRLGANPYVFAVDIQGHGTTDLMKSPKVFHLTGWSERMLDFMGQVEKGDELIKYIRSIEI